MKVFPKSFQFILKKNLSLFGNNDHYELQRYTGKRKENVRVENAHLTIHTHVELFDNRNYTSARITC